MATASAAHPDVTLVLDRNGVIREATLGGAAEGEGVDGWIGRPWAETVADAGGEKVRHLLEDARTARAPVLRQLTQRFPSGRELLMEYTTVELGEHGGLIAIGKSLQAVAELQSRLIAAQQAMERDYWKLRHAETRYRLLFNASHEAVLLLRVADLRVIEANPAALRALGRTGASADDLAGRPFLPEVAAEDRERVEATLARAREQGRAPGLVVHLGPDRHAWLLRASFMNAEGGPVYLLQLSAAAMAPAAREAPETPSVEALVDRSPDAFAVLDREGVIRRANRAFLDLVQVGAEAMVLGERLGRWLGRPGADLTVLLANLARHGVVRLFATTIQGELGGETSVEISATGDAEVDPRYFGVTIRDVGRRLAPVAPGADRLGAVLGSLTDQIGKTTLPALVKETVGVVERHYVEAALALTGGNRTAAAELLGLSRQSLYAKLDRYGLARDAEAPATGAG